MGPVPARRRRPVDGGGQPVAVGPGGAAVVDADLPQPGGIGLPADHGVVDGAEEGGHDGGRQHVQVGQRQAGVGDVVGPVAEEAGDEAPQQQPLVGHLDADGLAVGAGGRHDEPGGGGVVDVLAGVAAADAVGGLVEDGVGGRPVEAGRPALGGGRHEALDPGAAQVTPGKVALGQPVVGGEQGGAAQGPERGLDGGVGGRRVERDDGQAELGAGRRGCGGGRGGCAAGRRPGRPGRRPRRRRASATCTVPVARSAAVTRSAGRAPFSKTKTSPARIAGRFGRHHPAEDDPGQRRRPAAPPPGRTRTLRIETDAETNPSESYGFCRPACYVVGLPGLYPRRGRSTRPRVAARWENSRFEWTPELGVDVGQVPFDGAAADEQLVGDLGRRQPQGGQPGHLELPGGERRRAHGRRRGPPPRGAEAPQRLHGAVAAGDGLAAVEGAHRPLQGVDGLGPVVGRPAEDVEGPPEEYVVAGAVEQRHGRPGGAHRAVERRRSPAAAGPGPGAAIAR